VVFVGEVQPSPAASQTPTTFIGQVRPSPTALPVPVAFPKTGGYAGTAASGLALLLATLIVGIAVVAGARVLCGSERNIDD